MSTVVISIKVDPDDLQSWTDEYIAQLWHVAQANPAPFGDRDACELAEKLRAEIVRRWLAAQPPSLWNHQGRHAESARREAQGAAS